jgi:hypothetical protein
MAITTHGQTYYVTTEEALLRLLLALTTINSLSSVAARDAEWTAGVVPDHATTLGRSSGNASSPWSA